MGKPAKRIAKPLAQRTAVDATLTRLREEISECESWRLPSMVALCTKFGVSPRTISAAARQLRSEGVLDFYPGRGMWIVGQKPEVEKKKFESRAEALFSDLREEIVSGKRKSGEQLPKILYFVHEQHLSNRTVRQAYDLLESNGLAFRKGRHWYVGAFESRSARSTLQTAPVIFVIQAKQRTWASLSISERVRRFCFSFTEQAEKHAVRLVFMAVEGDPVHPWNMQQIEHEIHSLAGRYAGCLVVGLKGEFNEFENLITGLAAFRHPVVWFDSENEPFEEISPSNYIRAHFSEEKALSFALEILEDAGHTKIGYAEYMDMPWIYRRGSLLKSIARRMEHRNGMNVLIASHFRSFVKTADENALAHNLEELNARSPFFRNVFNLFANHKPTAISSKVIDTIFESCKAHPFLAPVKFIDQFGSSSLYHQEPFEAYDFYARLLVLTPFFTHFLAIPGLTAILCPNDSLAISFNQWFMAAGIKIPSHISLLSFDNYSSIWSHHISSVDFGFGNLGYATFHHILGDIPVKKDADGTLSTIPELANRGSLGEAHTTAHQYSFVPVLPKENGFDKD